MAFRPRWLLSLCDGWGGLGDKGVAVGSLSPPPPGLLHKSGRLPLPTPYHQNQPNPSTKVAAEGNDLELNNDVIESNWDKVTDE